MGEVQIPLPNLKESDNKLLETVSSIQNHLGFGADDRSFGGQDKSIIQLNKMSLFEASSKQLVSGSLPMFTFNSNTP